MARHYTIRDDMVKHLDGDQVVLRNLPLVFYEDVDLDFNVRNDVTHTVHFLLLRRGQLVQSL